MAGLFERAQSAVSSAYSYVANSYIVSTVSGAVTIASNYVSSSLTTGSTKTAEIVTSSLSIVNSSPAKLSQNLEEGLDGFSQSLNIPEIGKTLFTDKRPKTRRVFWHAASANLVAYMGWVLAYEYAFKQLSRQVPGMQENSWGEWGLDQAAHIAFLRLAIDTFATNFFANISLSTALSEETEANPNFKPCKHVATDPTALTVANVMSGPYYYVNLAAASIVSAIPYVGSFISLPLRTLIYGESLVEYKLGSECSEDRAKTLALNNAYSFGMGLSLMASVAFWNLYILQHRMGVKSEYAEGALFNILYMYHMLASYIGEKPLPGKAVKPVPGKAAEVDIFRTDVFYYPRLATDRLLTDGIKFIAPYMQGPEGDMYARLKGYANTDIGKLTRDILVTDSLQSMDGFMQRSSSLIYLDLHEQKVRDGISNIRSAKDGRVIQLYKLIGKYLPDSIVPVETRQILDNVVCNPELDNWLNNTENKFNILARMAVPNGKNYGLGVPYGRALSRAPIPVMSAAIMPAPTVPATVIPVARSIEPSQPKSGSESEKTQNKSQVMPPPAPKLPVALRSKRVLVLDNGNSKEKSFVLPVAGAVEKSSPAAKSTSVATNANSLFALQPEKMIASLTQPANSSRALLLYGRDKN